MKNYLNADFHRILTKRFRIILMSILTIANILYIIQHIASDKNVLLLNTEIGGLDLIYLLIVVITNMLISFRDDLRAKSMQAALGNGVKRHQIVFVKWINLAIITCLDLAFLTFVQFLPLIITHKVAGSFTVGTVIFKELVSAFTILITLPLAMIIIFQTQKALLGILFYVYLITGCTSSIITMALSNNLVQRFQLWNIGAVDQISTFLSKLWLGQFDIRNFLMVAFYVAIGFGGTIYFFRKKELDF